MTCRLLSSSPVYSGPSYQIICIAAIPADRTREAPPFYVASPTTFHNLSTAHIHQLDGARRPRRPPDLGSPCPFLNVVSQPTNKGFPPSNFTFRLSISPVPSEPQLSNLFFTYPCSSAACCVHLALVSPLQSPPPHHHPSQRHEGMPISIAFYILIMMSSPSPFPTQETLVPPATMTLSLSPSCTSM